MVGSKLSGHTIHVHSRTQSHAQPHTHTHTRTHLQVPHFHFVVGGELAGQMTASLTKLGQLRGEVARHKRRAAEQTTGGGQAA